MTQYVPGIDFHKSAPIPIPNLSSLKEAGERDPALFPFPKDGEFKRFILLMTHSHSDYAII